MVEEMPPVVGNRDQIHRLFQTLIGNAIKSRQSDRDPVVTNRTRPSNSAFGTDALWRSIEVVDNGIGIDPQYIDRAFSLFERPNGMGVYEGTGIGLAIRRRFVQQHGGTITVESGPGEGTSFTVRLPITFEGREGQR